MLKNLLVRHIQGKIFKLNLTKFYVSVEVSMVLEISLTTGKEDCVTSESNVGLSSSVFFKIEEFDNIFVDV